MIKNIVILFVTTFFRRLGPLGKMQDKAIQKLAGKYHLHLHIGTAGFKKWNVMVLKHVVVESTSYKLAFSAKEIYVQCSWLALIRKKTGISRLQLVKVHMHVRPVANTGNQSMPDQVKDHGSQAPSVINYYKQLNRLLQRFGWLVPKKIHCTDLALDYGVAGNICRVQETACVLSIHYPSPDDTKIETLFDSKGWWVNHPKISPGAFAIQQIGCNIQIQLQNDSFTIHETSTGIFNLLKWGLFFNHVTGKDNVVKLICTIEEITPADLLQSLPFISHKDIIRIKATGSLAFRFMLAFNLHDRRYHYFSPEVIRDSFSVQDAGNLNLAYLNNPFMHTIYEHGTIIKQLLLDTKNEAFASIEKIADHLIKAIICTEDPNYYKHHGVDGLGMGLAIVTNIRNRKYLRGGSTITMQLARNLFLGHNKNIARKFEEIILAWLMEGVFKISKKRLLEIYLNIIEFAPHVYGIVEACSFYFGKKPCELTLTECLVLTYIIPRPKFFADAVISKSPVLISKLKKHLALYGHLLLQRGDISKAQLDELSNEIQFAGELGTLELSEK